MSNFVIKADIHTMDNERPSAGAVVVHDETIVWVGEPEMIPAQYRDATVLDYSGKTIVPGFLDTHVHAVAAGMLAGGCDLSGAKTIADVQTLLKKKDEEQPAGGWLFAGHFQDKHIAEKRMPSCEDLDQVSTERPIFVYHNDCHPFAFNTPAIKKLGLDVSVDGICTDDGIHPNGIVVDPACADVEKRFFGLLSEEEYVEAFRNTEQMAVRNGITTIFAKEYLRTLQLLQKYRDTFLTTLKPMMRTPGGCGDTSELLELIADDCLNKETTVCTFLDGAFDGWSAANFEPYEGQPENYGMLYNTDEELYQFFHLAYKNKLQVSAHAIGDRALEQYLRVMSRLQGDFPEKDRRPRIEHYEMPTSGQIKRTAEMGVAVGMQPLLIEVCEGMDFSGYMPYVGERVTRCSPYRSVLEAGCLVGGGSDHPVTDMNPLHSISVLMRNPVVSQRVSAEAGLRMFTCDAARIGFLEHRKGIIREGMDADLAVLSGNPFTTEPDSILVEATISRGQIVYERIP